MAGWTDGSLDGSMYGSKAKGQEDGWMAESMDGSVAVLVDD
jgi:hypothetical protein